MSISKRKSHQKFDYKKIYYRSSAYQLVSDVIAIMGPLKKIGVVYFSYLEFTVNGEIKLLISDDRIPLFYIQEQGLYIDPLNSPLKVVPAGFYIHVLDMVTDPQQKRFYHRCFEIEGVRDVCTFVKDEINGIRKIYNFGLDNMFFRYYEELIAFTYHFDEKAVQIIQKSDKIVVPPNIENKNVILPMENAIESAYLSDRKSVKTFLEEINFNRHRNRCFSDKYGLSNREAQCLNLILQGKLAKEIAYQLNLKQKTIETYIGNLKSKLNCHTRTELLVKVLTEHVFL